MPIGIYFTPDSMSMNQYKQIIEGLLEAGALPNEHCLSHTCFGEGNELRVFDIFDTRDNFDRFAATLIPLIQKAGVQLRAPHFVEVKAFAAGQTEYAQYEAAAV